MNKKLTREESNLCATIYGSYEMQSRLYQHPEENKRIARDIYNDLFVANILEQINQKEWDKFAKLDNITHRVVNELFYAADNDIQKNDVTEKNQRTSYCSRLSPHESFKKQSFSLRKLFNHS